VKQQGAVEVDEAPLQDEPYDAAAQDLGTEEQAFGSILAIKSTNQV
jgi:hypothetical protein